MFQTVKLVKTYREGERKGGIEEKRGFPWGGGGTIGKCAGLVEGLSACSRGDCPSSVVKFRDRLYSLPQKDLS